MRKAASATMASVIGTAAQRRAAVLVVISTATTVSPSVIPARLNIMPGSAPPEPRPELGPGVTCRQVPENDDQISAEHSPISCGGPGYPARRPGTGRTGRRHGAGRDRERVAHERGGVRAAGNGPGRGQGGPHRMPYGHRRRHGPHRTRISVKIDVIPAQFPGLLGADADRETQHDVRIEPRLFGGLE
jgi:hypothetical protein